MPVHDGGGLDEEESSGPARPDAAQPDPEESITILEPWFPALPLEYHQLMPKRDVLKGEIPPTLQRGSDTPPRETHPIPHRRLLSRKP